MKKIAKVCVWLFGHRETTQLETARALGVSLCLVNYTVKILERMGAVKIGHRSLEVVDAESLLMYLANIRNTYKDVVYKTRVAIPVTEIERSMPPETTFAAYSAYRFRYREVPADYSEVYVYADESALEEIKGRFPPKEGPENLFVLKKEFSDVPDALLFADLWNLREWYAKDFVRELRGRILG